jgi:lambda family phage tail tape measure protein
MEKEKKKNKFTPTTPTADTGTAERDVYAETIEALIKMNQLEGQSTEVAKAGYEIRRGFAAEWNATQKATYLITAQIVDDTKAKIKEETEASAALVKQASDELKMRQQQADIVKKAKGDIAESATKSGAAIDLERATLGLTAIEKDLYLKMADIDSLVRKRVETLDKGSTTYADDIAEISKAAEKAKKDLTDLSNIKHEFDTSWANGAQQAFAAYADSADNAAKQSKDGILSAFSAMEQGLVNFATGVKTSWADMAKAILLDLEKIIAKQAVAGLVGGLGSLFKSKNSGGGPEGTASFIGPPSDLAASAMGNVFDTGGLVTAFASGGVISQPTMFGMGSGGLGIAGEAGPEAIMPLSRGPDGKLGVSVATSGGSSSGGTTIGSISIVVNESKSAKDTANEVSSKIQAEIMRNQMKSLLVDEKRPGGILSKG